MGLSGILTVQAICVFSCPFTIKLVFQANLSTLHGGVGLTMAKVREKFWVPRLRRLAKKIRRSCNSKPRHTKNLRQAVYL